MTLRRNRAICLIFLLAFCFVGGCSNKKEDEAPPPARVRDKEEVRPDAPPARHPDEPVTEKPIEAMTFQVFVFRLSENQLAFNRQYQGKVLEIEGIVDNVSRGRLDLTVWINGNNRLLCHFADSEPLYNLKVRTFVKVIGRYEKAEGYDVTFRGCRLSAP